MANDPIVKVFQLDEIVRVINSSAYLQAASLLTTVDYEKFSTNEFMNNFMMGMTGKPGIPGINADSTRIDAYHRKLAIKFTNEFFDKLSLGPRFGEDYLDSLAAEKARAKTQLDQTFQDARDSNAELQRTLQLQILAFSTIKAASTVVIAVTPVGLAAAGASASLIATAGGVSFVYGVTKDITKGIAAGDATAVAIDTTKNFGKEAASRGIEKAGETALTKLSALELVAREAEGRIATLSSDLARKVSSAKKAKLARQIGKQESKLAATTASIGTQTLVKNVAKFAPVVFAAWDILEAGIEYRDDLTAAGY